MPETAENQSLGQPVEIGKIDKELKKLWKEGQDAMAHASLINLAVYSEAPGSLAENTSLIAEITRNNACRSIVIGADPGAKENRVEAWISTHCQVSRAGSKQTCSEQISFRLEGPCTTLLPNIVFSHLDSDLPFYFWWQGELPDSMDAQLWAWVDRFIYDSQEWKNFGAQMGLVETAQQEAKQRIVLCDLNWMRLDKVRLAIAQFFDHPAAHHHFAELESGEIEFAPGHRSTALLLAGWLGAQLKWKVKKAGKSDSIGFVDEEGRTIEIRLREADGEPIGKVALRSSKMEFEVAHRKGTDLLEVSRGQPGEKRAHQLMPAGSNNLVSLMSDELSRGGPHRIYLIAVNCVRGLL